MKLRTLTTLAAALTIGTASFAMAQTDTPPMPTPAAGALPQPEPKVQRSGRVQNEQERKFATTMSTDSSPTKKFMSK